MKKFKRSNKTNKNSDKITRYKKTVNNPNISFDKRDKAFWYLEKRGLVDPFLYPTLGSKKIKF